MNKNDTKNTETLIEELSGRQTKVRAIGSPLWLMARWGLFTFLYACVLIYFIGFRFDIGTQLVNPLFLIENGLALLTVLTSATVAAYFFFPDCYRHYSMRWMPLLFFGAFNLYLLLQLVFPADFYQGAPGGGLLTFECTEDMAVFSLFPIIAMVYILRKGAPTQSRWAILHASIASVCTAYIMLRVIEPDDRIIHILSWHYTPMIAIIFISLVLGKKILRW
jgi:hypothetical protein